MDRLLLPRDCVPCPASPPPCSCPSVQTCVLTAQTCTACASFTCEANSASSNATTSAKGNGVSTGALAGAVVGSLILLALAAGLVFWYRRKARVRLSSQSPEVKEVPASATDVLNRPDPNEKAYTAQPAMPTPPVSSEPAHDVRLYKHNNATIDLDSNSLRVHPAHSADSNPFEDGQSIRTTSTSTHGTNVIPIEFVPRNMPHSAAPSSQVHPTGTLVPPRPTGTSGVDLNLEHVNVSRDSLRAATPRGSSADRNSYMSGLTSVTDIMNEAPTIVTPNKVTRQVVGLSKAEVIQTPGTHSSMPTTPSSLRASTSTSRPSVRSPLATKSFGPIDVVPEVSENGSPTSVRNDPFGDEHSPLPDFASVSTESSLGTPLSEESKRFRPISVDTQAASIISANIGSARRVQVGLSPTAYGDVPTTALSPSLTPRLLHRMTSGRLVTPPTNGSSGTLQEQQARAFAHAQAGGRDQLDAVKRSSTGSSVISGRDSILENFPFVPPSPISNRPARSPPASPLSQQSFAAAAPSENAQPRNRKTLGMSTGSQISTASTGLGSFPFQIEGAAPAVPPVPTMPPPPSFGRQRASLDTLALTSTLSSYPLGYDSSENSSQGHGSHR